MTPSDVSTLILSILAGLTALVTAFATLVAVFRVSRKMESVHRDINGRVDQLIAEQEERIRAQERLRHFVASREPLPPGPAVGRGEAIIRRLPPEQPNT